MLGKVNDTRGKLIERRIIENKGFITQNVSAEF